MRLCVSDWSTGRNVVIDRIGPGSIATTTAEKWGRSFINNSILKSCSSSYDETGYYDRVECDKIGDSFGFLFREFVSE